MKIKNFSLILAFYLFIVSYSFADSPLTSTDFYLAYEDVEIVNKAGGTNGMITEELIEYLIDENNPIDIKMAVINRIGWIFGGNNNSDTFLDYLIQKGKYNSLDDFIERGRGDEILCFAYIKALDDYFNVAEAGYYAEKALSLNPTSYTFNIITALIRAQYAMDYNWCDVYTFTNNVRLDTSLEIDMRNKAIDIIFEYMDLYKGFCN